MIRVIKFICLSTISIATVIGSSLPSRANWGSSGSAAQGMAMAYCSARTAGKDHKGAVKDASAIAATGMTGSFTSNIASLFVGGKQMWQTTFYAAQKICPEHFGLLPGQNCPPFQPDPGHQTSCQTTKLTGKYISTGVVLYPNGLHSSSEGYPMIAFCDSDFSEQGLRPGDYVVSWNGKNAASIQENKPGSWYQDGQTFNVRIKRSKRIFDVILTSRLGIHQTVSKTIRTGQTLKYPPKPSFNCWSTYLDDNPSIKAWTVSNPGPAAQNKRRFDDC